MDIPKDQLSLIIKINTRHEELTEIYKELEMLYRELDKFQIHPDTVTLAYIIKATWVSVSLCNRAPML